MAGARGTALLSLPAIALLLLAAHFVHAGLWPIAAACIAATALLAVPRAWAARTLQVLLAIGAVEWVLTAAVIAHMRVAQGQPYLRMLTILGVVCVLTVVAALTFQHPALRRRFGLGAIAENPAAHAG
jgi:hypothetical protein